MKKTYGNSLYMADLESDVTFSGRVLAKMPNFVKIIHSLDF